MEKHETVLAALLVGLGFVGCLLGIVVFTAIMGGGLIAGEADVLAITSTVAVVLGLIIFGFAAPPLLGGIGLLVGARWGRVLALIACAMNLVNIPFGTFVGIYGIWVLGRTIAPQAPPPQQSVPAVV